MIEYIQVTVLLNKISETLFNIKNIYYSRKINVLQLITQTIDDIHEEYKKITCLKII